MTAKKTAAVPPMDPQTQAALLRAARGQISAAPAAVPMGIRYRTPAAPARPAPVDHRPLWMTLASATVLEEIAEAKPRAGNPRRQRRQTPPPVSTPPRTAAAPTAPPVSLPATPEPVDEPDEATATVDAPEVDAQDQVLRRFNAYSCEACGSRYTRDDEDHPCGPLTPVTVTVAGIAAPPPQEQILGRYDAYACPACDGRWGHDMPEHGCGPLTPVTVTITARAAGEPA